MGDKTIVRAKILDNPDEDELNEALKKLDKHYILSVVPLAECHMLITYSKKVQRNEDESEEGEE